MTKHHFQKEIQRLKRLEDAFLDKPYILQIVQLGTCESEKTLEFIRNGEIYAKPVNVYMTGRTGSGKTTVGNLLFGKAVLNSSGHIDCTDFLAICNFKNLIYFDTPGAGSNEKFENINRAIYCMPQLTDEEEVTDFKVNKYSDTGESIESDKVIIVSEWQLPENQAKFAPDVIIYMIADNQQFLREDKKYLEALIKARQKVNPKNQIIFVLNKFHKEGVRQASDENIEDCRNGVKEVYNKFYPNDEAPIVEVDAKTGYGIHALTGSICRLVPPDKLGKMESGLDKKLKAHATRERSRRYRDNVIQIASRLALKRVDFQLGQEGIVKQASMAILSYGILTFENTTLKTDELQQQLEAQAKAVTNQKTEAINTQEVTTREEDNIVYRTKTIKKEWEEDQYFVVENPRQRIGLGPIIWEDGGGSHVEKRTVKKQQFVPETVASKEGTRTVVDRVLNKEIGKKYLKGGFEIIKLLLSIALGCESCAATAKNSQAAFVSEIEAAEKEVESKLLAVKSQLESLVNADDEKQLVELIKTSLNCLD
ncbi:MAG: hypothetical protein WBB28_15005 [Crinalium sp.]